ncbi:MAG: hypothetical protein ACRDHW_02040 [Ktedonobacteraceae bacterium]
MKNHTHVLRIIQSRYLWLALLAAVLVLFPFDWLSDVWPAYALVFERVFATVLAHEIGHTSIFLLAGLLILCAIPQLRRHPLLYALIMALGALGEESFQALSRWRVPNFGDGRDLGFDALGFVLAYLLVWAWWRIKNSRERIRK